MFYHLSLWLKPYLSIFNVLHYVSFRAMAALLSTLFFSFSFGGWFIEKSKLFFRSKVREWTPERHKQKNNTPTMGGIFILMAVVANCLLWCNLAKPHVWIFLLCVLSFGAIGFWDDWCKIKYQKGISARAKFLLQILTSCVVGVFLLLYKVATPTIAVPFFKNINPDIGLFFIPWVVLVLVGCSNAVNLADGLDGLAIGSLIPNFATFALISFLAGHCVIAQYLHIPFADSAELAIVGTILVGTSLGFLWYNSYPAQIFMGDVGSMALGSGLAVIALMTKQEMLLVISGGLFVVEALSVMLQVFTVKRWRKRLLKMAPLHHHFELLGWPETKITIRFAIISIILCLIVLMTLKLR